ncbi:hemerythrin domain-containing protein [Sphingomonas nostoxanthinifaciens]|uniref:hemerythrin domain-containing protein n=1 Tax=Sphingomonas nostoxanthinifaciens TaxID=2872652 RepID=UPI001CC1E85A|nr:hemerythrin domain-containing protein [Sphingomonas nostoxanthinifaciens]UAK26406.1 hemerythrin domain-containing protein [Sphingomonas nostoxanthinifaciens]
MDICQLILDDHAEQRRLFAMIEEIGAGDPDALRPIWQRLQALLDAHAEAEERFFYPDVLMVGHGANDADSAEDETKDAIEDHNDIRDTGAAVDRHEVGSDAWFEAVGKCNLANSKHMAEEERQGMTDMRQHASRERRHQLAVKFAAFGAAHLTGVKPVDKDPKAYVEAHSPD